MRKKYLSIPWLLALFFWATVSFSDVTENKTMTCTCSYLIPKNQPLNPSIMVAKIKSIDTLLFKAAEYLRTLNLTNTDMASVDETALFAAIYFDLITDMNFDLNVAPHDDGNTAISTSLTINISTAFFQEAYHRILNDTCLLTAIKEIQTLKTELINNEERLSLSFQKESLNLSKNEIDDMIREYTGLAKKIQATFYQYKALSYWNDKRFTMPLQALSYLEKAYQNNTDDLKTLIFRANAYRDLGLYEKALNDYSTLLKQSPDHITALFNRGKAYAALGEYENALKDFNGVTVLTPGDKNVYMERGKVFEAMKAYDKAAEDYSKAMKISKDDLLPYFKRANIYHITGLLDDAEADYKTITQMDPQNADAYYKCGLIMKEMGKTHMAVEYIGKAIELDPAGAEYYKDRGYLYQQLNRITEACKDFEKACEFGNCSGIFRAKKNKICK